jgi:hypothetical protein
MKPKILFFPLAKYNNMIKAGYTGQAIEEKFFGLSQGTKIAKSYIKYKIFNEKKELTNLILEIWRNSFESDIKVVLHFVLSGPENKTMVVYTDAVNYHSNCLDHNISETFPLLGI